MNKEEVKKAVKKAVVLIAASAACMSLFACGTKTKYENSNQKYLNKGESMDGKITGRTRIENGLVMEWQEDFPMDKEIIPIAVEQKSSENGYCFKYIVDGTEINAYVNNTSKNRTFLIGPIEDNNQFATVGAKSKSNEQVLKSVAAADAIEKAMKARTK